MNAILETPRSATLAAGLAIAAVSGAIKSFRPASGLPFWLDLAAVVVLALVLRRSPCGEPLPEQVSPVLPPLRTRWIGALLAASGLALCALCALFLYADWRGSLLRVFVWGPAGLLLFGLGLDLAFGYGPRWLPRVPRWRAGGREALLLSILLLAGAYFRFRSFGVFPPPDGFSSVEETQEASAARLVLEAHARPWEWPLSIYLPAGAFSLFGLRMETLRGLSTALGWLTIIPLFGMFRSFAGPLAAFFGAALFAVSRWPVQMSWYSDEAYVPLAAFVLFLWLLFRAVRDPRPLWYVAIGALAGHSLYYYAAFRVMLLVALLFFVLELVRRRTEAAWRRALPAAAAVFLLFVAPLIGRLREAPPGYYFEAMGRSLANTEYYSSDVRKFAAQRLERVRASARAFTITDGAVFFETLNTGAAPLLDPFSSVAFVLGFGTSVALLKRRHHLFLVSAFVILVLGATTLVQNLDFRRLAPLGPFAFAFPALFADKLLALFPQRKARGLVGAGILVAALLAASWNFRFLFHRLAADPHVRATHRNEYTVPAFYLHRHHRGEYVVVLTPDDGYVIGNFFESNDYDWIKPSGLRGEVKVRVEEVIAPSPPFPSGRGLLVLVQRPFELEDVIVRIRRAYPQARCGIQRDRDQPFNDLGACRIPP